MKKPFNEHNPVLGKSIPAGELMLHGDVIIFGENKLPNDFEGFPVVKDNCLAYGEATGHAHELVGPRGSFELREEPKTKTRFLKVVKADVVFLKHQEHRPIQIAPGAYRIGIQQEYSPWDKLVRNVQD